MGSVKLGRTTTHVPVRIRSKLLHTVLAEANVNDAYVTGSVALACAQANSDLDIVVPIQYRGQIMDILRRHGYLIEESLYNNGFKFSSDGPYSLINVIPLHPLDWHAWYWATQMLASKDLTGADRNDRHRLFEFAVLAYKTLLARPSDYHVNSAGDPCFARCSVIATEV